jgi:hypothetical protein
MEVTMKQLRWCSLVTLLSVFIASCSSKVYVEKDPSTNMGTYKTYAWVDTKNSKETLTALVFTIQTIALLLLSIAFLPAIPAPPSTREARASPVIMQMG